MDNKSKYSAFTVNDRLYVSGLIDKFYQAKEKDKSTAITILKEVDLGEENIKAILQFNCII